MVCPIFNVQETESYILKINMKLTMNEHTDRIKRIGNPRGA